MTSQRIRLAALATLAILGCGSPESRLKSGVFTTADTSLADATLELNLEGRTAVLTAFGDQTTLSLTSVGSSRWRTGCPTQYSSIRLETFDLRPSPLPIGALTLSSPQLTAGCATDGREVLLRGTQDDGGERSILFVRAER